jgi:hypothetical protein
MRGALVDGAGDFVVAQHRDHPLDLAPAAEVDEIANGAAAVRANRRFRDRVVAEAVDKLGRVGQGFPAGEMDVVTQGFPRFFSRRASSLATLTKRQTARVNA